MSQSNNIVQSIHHLKMGKEHMEDFCRQHKDSIGARIFKTYIARIDWIFRDITTSNIVGEFVREGLKKEINSDVFTVPAITEKVALLDPDQREALENVIDSILKGEKIKIEYL